MDGPVGQEMKVEHPGRGSRERATILGESRGLYFLYKPAGMPVFPFHHKGDPRGPSLMQVLLELLPELGSLAWPPGFEAGLAHRLDTYTSGLVVACANPEVLRRLRMDFQQHRLAKQYLFISSRRVRWNRHVVEKALAHDRTRRSRMVVKRGSATPHRGRWYEAETRFSRSGEHLWRAEISTGVTHQVRIHAASVGLAILGDRLYGGAVPSWLETVGARNSAFFLHHERILAPGWRSPRVPLPAAWADVLLRLAAGHGP